MRKSLGFLLITLLLVLGGCEQITAPDQLDLSYRGQPVLDTTPAWALGGHALARVNSGAVAVSDTTSSSTVYGTDTSSVYLATGGEVLPAGTWMDQASSGTTYTVSLLKKTHLIFESEATVLIKEPVDTQYLAPNGAWQMIVTTGTVQALEIRTGNNGSCTITSDVRYTIGGDEGDWG